MTYIRHILQYATLFFLLLVAFRPTSAQERDLQPVTAAELQRLGATPTDTPSWETLGLEDILAAPSQTSWSAPQSGTSHFGSAHQRTLLLAVSSLPSPLSRRLHPQPLRSSVPNDYYLFFLYRLRL